MERNFRKVISLIFAILTVFCFTINVFADDEESSMSNGFVEEIKETLSENTEPKETNVLEENPLTELASNDENNNNILDANPTEEVVALPSVNEEFVVSENDNTETNNENENENESEEISNNDNGNASVTETGNNTSVTNHSESENSTPTNVSHAGDEPTEYSVTFSYQGYVANLQGGASMSLSRLAPKLGISLSLSDVFDVVASDNTVLSVTHDNTSNDWMIQSLKYFETEETLTVRLKNGTQYIIKVTDPTPDHSKVLIVNGDGTYSISLDVTGDADKKVNKINVIVIVDRSGSMGENSGTASVTYTETNSNYYTTQYGLSNGEYVLLTRTQSGYGPGATVTWYLNGTVYTGQRYLKQEANQTRMQATQEAINNLAQALLSKNGGDNPADTVEMALVSFSTGSRTDITKTASYSTFSSAVNGLSSNGGTNWEAALQQAYGINFNDNNPTFVIFVSDGAPTFHSSNGGYNNWNNSYNVYGSGQEQEPNMERSYTQAVDDATSLATKVGKSNFYTIFAYGEDYGADYMSDLTTAAGASSSNNFNASNTAGLQAAFAEILNKIEMAGFGNVGLNDGTTSEVNATSGSVSGGMLDVADPTTYKYYFSFPVEVDEETGALTSAIDHITEITSLGNDQYKLKNKNGSEYIVTRVPAYSFNPETGIQNSNEVLNNVFKFEWTDEKDSNNQYNNPFHNQAPIAATFTNNAVNWDLSSLGVLIDGLTYNVTFDCWPSQVTLDLISDLKNGNVEYFDYNSLAEYVIKTVDGDNVSYTKYSKNQETGEVTTTENYTPTSSDTIIVKNNNRYFIGETEIISPEVRKYLIKSGDGANATYTLLTNTEASLSFVDTRTEEGPQTTGYENPDPVPTSSIEMFEVVKTWIGTRTDEDKYITLYIDRDGNTDPKIYAIDLNEDNDYKNSVYVSIGIMIVDEETGTINIKASGHDFSFSETQDLSWRWELTAPTVRPMLINGEPATLFLNDGTPARDENGNIIDIEWPKASDWPEGDDNAFLLYKGNKFYRLDGKYYRLGLVGEARLTATNEKRSNLDVNKTITNGFEDDTQLFTYNVTINTSNHEDYWFSIWDGSGFVTDPNCIDGTAEVIEIIEDGTIITNVTYGDNVIKYTKTINGVTTEVEDDYITIDVTTVNGKTKYSYTTGYYYAPSGSEVTLKIRQGWNLRFLNVPTGSDYTITEVESDSVGYSFDSVTVTYKDSGTQNAPTTDNSVETPSRAVVKGTIELGNKTYNVAYKNLVKVTSVEVAKVWNDANDQDGKRSDVVAEVQLYKTVNGEKTAVGSPVIVGDADDWTNTWEDLPVYESGVIIVYSVEETLKTAMGYAIDSITDPITASEDELSGTITVTNAYTPETDELTVTKVWDDASDQDGKRPEVVTFTVTGSDGKTYDVELSGEGDTWTAKVTVDKLYNGGEEVTFTVDENEVSDYEKTIDNETLTITNAYTPETTSVQVIKIWDDAENQDGKRPSELVVTLSNGDTVTLNEANNWTATIKDLPVNSKGQKITYTWTEAELPEGYTLTNSEVDETGYITTLTNSYTPEEINIKVVKEWEDDDNFKGLRPTEVTIALYANGKVYEEVTLTLEGNWQYVFNNLPVYEDGEKIEYTVLEENVPEGYVPAYEGNAEDGFTVYNNLGQGDVEPEPPYINPQTGDNIMLYVNILLLSIAGFASGKIYLKRYDF